ncbi:IS66 Orf2 like protein [Flexilinea flocculi]|uniref:IS66 Orf2 like protein n=2 Tax=Flexilinea flocculi TaxID=1678840 RepID=A0A0S7BJD3_9CHLR|nr:IS66 Orf2 like protein [Flexilinea flocculi]
MLKLLENMNHFYVATGYTDIRKGIDGLAVIVKNKYGQALEEDSLFLFCGRKSDRFKGLFWDGTGYVLLYKRLADSRFQWPRNAEELKQITPQEFRWLMDGLSIYQARSIQKTKQRDLF